MRFINEIFTAKIGIPWTNERLLSVYVQYVGDLGLDDKAQRALCEFIRFQLGGERTRYTVVRDWSTLSGFRKRAEQFEAGADEALDGLAPQITAAVAPTGITFDAVLTTTATGNLMPGLSYRMARRLDRLIRPDSMMIDLANAGCTGSSKALRLAASLQPDVKNILLLAVELPTTLLDIKGAGFDLWQGNCTFGDGAAALWISSDREQGTMALALEELASRQFAGRGLRLIRWGYRDYYAFTLSDHETFDNEVRSFVTEAMEALSFCERRANNAPLSPVLGGEGSGVRGRSLHASAPLTPTPLPPSTGGEGKERPPCGVQGVPAEEPRVPAEEPRWAIHPAGIALLMRLSRKLGIPMDAIRPSMEHYRAHSNMSSVSILHLLGEVARQTPAGSAINLLTMGAGFEVLHGRVRRLR